MGWDSMCNSVNGNGRKRCLVHYLHEPMPVAALQCNGYEMRYQLSGCMVHPHVSHCRCLVVQRQLSCAQYPMLLFQSPILSPVTPWVITSAASCQLTQPQSIVPCGVGLASTAQYFCTCLFRRHVDNVLYRLQGPNNSSLWIWHLLTYLRTYLLTYLPIYLLTPWSKVFLVKLTGSQLVKKFRTLYRSRMFITAITRARPCPMNII